MVFEEFWFYLIICFLLSFLIGVERQYQKRTVGLRTTILVSIGAFLFVSFSFSVGSSDISRIASQVVAGIGFLGAGVILKDGKKVRGLTTAATLWCDAAIGTLCAGGALREAILGTLIILFSNIVLRYVNRLINEISNKKHNLFLYKLDLSLKSNFLKKVKNELAEFINSNHIQKNSQTMQKKLNTIILNYEIEVTSEDVLKLEKIIDKLNEENQIESFQLSKISEIKLEESEEDL